MSYYSISEILEMITPEMIAEWLVSQKNVLLRNAGLEEVSIEQLDSFFFRYNENAKVQYYFEDNDNDKNEIKVFYSVILLNNFHLLVRTIKNSTENGTWWQSGTIIYPIETLMSVIKVAKNSWTFFLIEKLGKPFLDYLIYLNLNPEIIAGYLIFSKVIEGHDVTVLKLLETDNFKLFFFTDNYGYEYRFQISKNMNCFLLRSFMPASQISGAQRYIPKYLDIKCDISLDSYIKKVFFEAYEEDC